MVGNSFEEDRAGEDVFSVAMKIYNYILAVSSVLDENAGNTVIRTLLFELP